MNMKAWAYLASAGLLLLLAAGSGSAEEVKYKEFGQSGKSSEFFKITLEKKQVQVTAFFDDRESVQQFRLNDLAAKNGQVYAGDILLFDEAGLVIEGRTYPYDQVSDTRVFGSDDHISILFMTSTGAAASVRRFKRGNLIETSRDLVVDSDEFIRGLVLSLTGSIEIYGEVNRDVISLLGDVYVGPGAVVRGDIVSFSGRVDVARDASVYGEVFRADKRRTKYRHRFYRGDKAIDAIGDFVYNRVDGATLYFGAEFSDSDSLLPLIRAQGGYAFASERWRYEFGLEQIVLRDPAIAVGGALYRRLASEDDWLIGNWENTTFALLVTEDFKDYYEGEGGTLFVRGKPMDNLTVECRYRYEETRWLPANRDLWSLFGGDKKFGDNFERVPYAYRLDGIREIDTTANAGLTWEVDYDTRDEDDPFDRSAWHVTANLEWSHPDLSSDFDYRRYTLSVRRYQEIHRHAMLLLKGIYGGSDGHLPMYKRFYMGGLGTLRGYKHKEFMGSRFWMATAEYRIAFPKTDVAVSVFWDGAQIANDTRLDRDVETRHDLGMALYLGKDFKVSLAKRLDHSFDDDPKFYVRLNHVF